MVLFLCNFETIRNLADAYKVLHLRTSAADGLQGAPLLHEAGQEQWIPPGILPAWGDAAGIQ